MVTRPAAAARAQAAASGEAAQRSLARAAAKARRAGRFGQLQEAPGQLDRLPDSVVAALARCGGCRVSTLHRAHTRARCTVGVVSAVPVESRRRRRKRRSSRSGGQSEHERHGPARR